MANKFASNFPIKDSISMFASIWKLSRCMKAAGWTVLASSDGIYRDLTGIAANDIWGGSADPMTDIIYQGGTYLGGGGTLPVSSLSLPGSTNITGFNENGGTLTVRSSAGLQTLTYTSFFNTTISGVSGGTGTIATSSWIAPGTVNFGEINNVAQWIVLRGPSTIKIPLSAAPTGVFVRGEKITQATSAAEGELLGYVWDSVGVSGWAVIAPHTGTWDNSHTVTGATSGATFVPTGTIVTYLREMQFVRAAASGVNGAIQYICADGYEGTTSGVATTTIASGSNGQAIPGTGNVINVASTSGFPNSGYILIQTSTGLAVISYTNTSGGNQFTGTATVYGTGNMSTGGTVTQAGAESGQLFSTLAQSSGCTVTTPPGWGGTNNAFPTKGLVFRGSGTNTATDYVGLTSPQFENYSQMGCMNATPGTNVTADGSFWIAIPNSNTTWTSTGFIFTRLDDGDPGDCDPYVWLGSGQYQNSNFTGQTNIATASSTYFWNITNLYQVTYYQGVGYQSRGNTVTSRDSLCGFRCTYLAYGGGTVAFSAIQGSNSITSYLRTVNTPSATITTNLPRDQIGVYASGSITSLANVVPHWKGRCRWLHLTPIGNYGDTFDNNTWLCVSNSQGQLPGLLVPYDGSSTPIV